MREKVMKPKFFFSLIKVIFPVLFCSVAFADPVDVEIYTLLKKTQRPNQQVRPPLMLVASKTVDDSLSIRELKNTLLESSSPEFQIFRINPNDSFHRMNENSTVATHADRASHTLRILVLNHSFRDETDQHPALNRLKLGNFAKLPRDLWFKITDHLDGSSLTPLARTNSAMQAQLEAINERRSAKRRNAMGEFGKLPKDILRKFYGLLDDGDLTHLAQANSAIQAELERMDDTAHSNESCQFSRVLWVNDKVQAAKGNPKKLALIPGVQKVLLDDVIPHCNSADMGYSSIVDSFAHGVHTQTQSHKTTIGGRTAARLLSELPIHDPGFLDKILSCLRSERAEANLNACDVIIGRNLRSEEFIEALYTLSLESGGYEAREKAVDTLVALFPDAQPICDRYTQSLSHPSEVVRLKALWALRRLAGVQFNERAIARLFDDSDKEVAAGAADFFANVRAFDPWVIEQLHAHIARKTKPKYNFMLALVHQEPTEANFELLSSLLTPNKIGFLPIHWDDVVRRLLQEKVQSPLVWKRIFEITFLNPYGGDLPKLLDRFTTQQPEVIFMLVDLLREHKNLRTRQFIIDLLADSIKAHPGLDNARKADLIEILDSLLLHPKEPSGPLLERFLQILDTRHEPIQWSPWVYPILERLQRR